MHEKATACKRFLHKEDPVSFPRSSTAHGTPTAHGDAQDPQP